MLLEVHSPLKRFAASTVVVLLAAIGLTVVPAVAANATIPSVSGVAKCDTSTGEWVIDWTVGSDLNPAYADQTATIVTQSRATTPTLVGQSVKGTSTVTAPERVSAAGTYTQKVEVQWTNHAAGDLVSQSGDVVVSGTCTVPPPPLVTSTYTAEVLSCTPGSQNRVSLVGKSGGYWTEVTDTNGNDKYDAGEDILVYGDGVSYTETNTSGPYVGSLFSFTDSRTGTVTVDFSWKPVDPSSLKCPQTINQCTVSTGTTLSTNLNRNGWDFSQTRSYGSNEYVPGGLEVKTFGPDGIQEPRPGGGTQNADKAAGYYNIADIQHRDIGEVRMDYTSLSGGAPGLQLAIDKENDGLADGYLVGEPNAPGYGANWWASVNDGRFGVGSGAGYADFGTLDEYLTQWPSAKITEIGYSLGSGLKGDGVIKSITAGCHTYTFNYVAPVAGSATVNDACTPTGVGISTAVTAGTSDQPYSVEYDGVSKASGIVPAGTTLVVYTSSEPEDSSGGSIKVEVLGANSALVLKSVDISTDCNDTPVNPDGPTFKDECGVSNDTTVLPGTATTAGHSETASATYAVTSVTNADGTKTDTVTATPKTDFVFNAPDKDAKYTLTKSGEAVWVYTFTNVACPTTVTELPTLSGLAHTGSGPSGNLTGLAVLTVMLGLAGLLHARRKAVHAE